MAFSKEIIYVLIIVSFFIVFLLIIYINNVKNFVYDYIPDALFHLKSTLEFNKKINCNQKVTYCFSDRQCNQRCSSQSTCSNGICLNLNIFNSVAPTNECDAQRGVLTFFVGNPAIGRYDNLCKSIDPGIANDDITKPNLMCTNGTIDINYLQSFPLITDCNCPENYSLIIIPSTPTVREYSVCVPNEKRHLYI